MKRIDVTRKFEFLPSSFTWANLVKLVADTGAFVRTSLVSVGVSSRFVCQVLAKCFTYPWYGRQIRVQIMKIGFESLPIVALTSFCVGAVMIIQLFGVSTTIKVADTSIITAIVYSITREFGPVICGLMVAGRMSSAIATEIGTMKVSEQLDAMINLSTDPFRYLIVPRLIAAVLVMPLLVMICDTVGIFGSYVVGVTKLSINPDLFLRKVTEVLLLFDLFAGLVKGFVFGIIISLVGCYHGYHAKKSTEGIGVATTKSVVTSFVMILVMNYVMTEFLFYG